MLSCEALLKFEMRERLLNIKLRGIKRKCSVDGNINVNFEERSRENEILV